MASKIPIKDRITAAIKEAGGRIKYYDLARKVFPEDQYPRAFRYRTEGGPPGCYMALSRAISRHGFHLRFSDTPRSGVCHATVSLGRNKT
ncbi:hypothetical protein [Synechococcus virus S-ESS1]|uniref:Uncharacterized protein n=1 Tax=Synechococcus virus S-ESS1 TaxID=1964565 RepID=A0A1V0DX69_9CAUD|nr:hypothetical protein JT310_gp45 [Synechococcus virus S-ESS1]ARB05741.1 hypothetical protein [Synechococcus virus S-ESS1]